MQEIARRTARITGGLVHMPIYMGVGAFYGKTNTLPHGGINFDEDFVKDYALRLCDQLDKLGFQLIVMLYGHTNPGNINAYEGAAFEYMKRPFTKAKVLALNDINPSVKHRYKCRDHAAKWETSFMMATCPNAVHPEEVGSAHGPWWGLDPLIHASAAEGERMYTLVAQETAKLVEAAMELSKEMIIDMNFAVLAGNDSQYCWQDCRNIDDLETGFWQGDQVWEDPFCPFCAWRSPGVVRQLASIKGNNWMEALVAYWKTLYLNRYKYKLYDAFEELLKEWEDLKTGV